MQNHFWSVVSFMGDSLDDMEHSQTRMFLTQDEAKEAFQKEEQRLENIIKTDDSACYWFGHVRRMCHTFEQNIDISDSTDIDKNFGVWTELTSTMGIVDGEIKKDGELKA